MEKLSLQELQYHLLELLKIVTDFCDDNQLTYCLAYGTLLGAVRHNGFIPWDDDVDIVMPRDDYEKFIEIFNHKSSYYQVKSCKYDKEYPYPFAKVCDNRFVLKENLNHDCELGLYIDVFPVDYFASINRAEKIFKLNRKLTHLWIISTLPKKKNRNILKRTTLAIIHFLLPPNRISRMIDNICSNETKRTKGAKYCGISSFGGTVQNEIVESSVFKQFKMQAFENYSFRIPKKSDKYLTSIYGNYMELPPEEERISKHNYIVFPK